MNLTIKKTNYFCEYISIQKIDVNLIYLVLFFFFFLSLSIYVCLHCFVLFSVLHTYIEHFTFSSIITKLLCRYHKVFSSLNMSPRFLLFTISFLAQPDWDGLLLQYDIDNDGYNLHMMSILMN